MNNTSYPTSVKGYDGQNIDLNSLAIKHPTATFFMKYHGSPLADYGVFYDDILIIDSSLAPAVGKLVIIRTPDGYVCKPIIAKRIYNGKQVFTYKDRNDMEHICMEIFGTVTAVFKTV